MDDPERVLGALARANDGVFTRSHARAAGIPDAEIRSRLRSRLWVAEFGGGLRAGTTPLTMAVRERAALARTGPPAALSHLSAARHWALGTPELDPALESILAGEFARLAAAAGIRLVAGFRLPDGGEVVCDVADPTARLAVEVDGLAYHSTAAQVAATRHGTGGLLRAGWVTARYCTDDVRRGARRTINDLRLQLAARRRSP